MKLSKKEFYKKLDIYNYISVSSMFLNKIKFSTVFDEDLKKEVRGHYGTTPSLNFILIALDDFAKTINNNAIFILGTGHAGLSLLVYNYMKGALSENNSENANCNEFKYNKDINGDLQLQGNKVVSSCDNLVNSSLCKTCTKDGGNLCKYQYRYAQNLSGLNNFVSSFGEEFGFRSEASPFIPNTIYDGDELGYALATAYGTVWNRENLVTFCFMGDGEFETGTTFSSFLLNKAFKGYNVGTVIPIINLNGFRMGKNSYLSNFSVEQLKAFFGALEYDVYFANDYQSLDLFFDKLLNYLNDKNGYVPLLILNIPKGSFAPITQDIDFVGKSISHKNPLGSYSRDLYATYLTKWLEYCNVSLEDILNQFENDDVIGQKVIEKSNYKALVLPNLDGLEVSNCEKSSSAKTFSDYCNSVIEKNTDDFIVISPDELTSNRYLALNSFKNNYFEILNENICQGLLQGVLSLGKNGIIFAYEGFMPIVCSMISQYAKYTYQRRLMRNREVRASLNYAITSVVWENCYSHQNPEIISSLNNKEYDFINTYFPLDCNMLLCATEKMLKSTDEINLLVFSKRDRRQYLSLCEAKVAFDAGFNFLRRNNGARLIIAVGDTMADVAMDYEDKEVDVLYVSVLKTFQMDDFIDVLKHYSKIAILFHGYKTLIKSFLFDLRLDSDIKVFGYEDKSITSGFLNYKLEANRISNNDINAFFKS